MVIRRISCFVEIVNNYSKVEIKSHIKLYGHLLCGVFCLIERYKKIMGTDCCPSYLRNGDIGGHIIFVILH